MRFSCLVAIWILSVASAQSNNRSEKAIAHVGENVTLSCHSPKTIVQSCFWTYTEPGSAGPGFDELFGVSKPTEQEQSKARPKYSVRMNYQTGECQLNIDAVNSSDAMNFRCTLYKVESPSDALQVISETVYDVDVKVWTTFDFAIVYNDKEVENLDIVKVPNNGEQIKVKCVAGPYTRKTELTWVFEPTIVNLDTLVHENVDNGTYSDDITVSFALGLPPENIQKVKLTCKFRQLDNTAYVYHDNSTEVTFELTDDNGVASVFLGRTNGFIIATLFLALMMR